jgi:hypothetical protein
MRSKRRKSEPDGWEVLSEVDVLLKSLASGKEQKLNLSHF